MSEIVNKNIGHATAYGYAKSKGYTGTEEQFATLMASYADVGQTAVDAALAAKASEDAAKASETAAEASETAAATSAGTATTAAQTATQAASTATTKASEATTAATTATGKAAEAAQSATGAAASATTAGTAATNAQTAQTAAEAAQGKAEDAQAAAEAAAQTLVIDPTLTQPNQAAEAKATGDAISLLKSHLNAIDIVDTASGAIATFADGSDGIPVESLTVSLEPIQNLNGQSNPYPAGGGKNKIPFPYAIGDGRTVNGVTAVVSSEGYITFNGTATANSDFPLIATYYDLPAGTYTLSGMPSSGGTSTFVYNCYGMDESNTVMFDFRDTGRTFTAENQIKRLYLYIRIIEGYTANNLIIKPQLESGSTATPYAPYSNICPISGRQSVTVWRSGGNIWDEETAPGIINNSGEFVPSTNAFRSKNPIPVTPGQKLYIVNGSGTYIYMKFYDSDGGYVGSPINNRNGEITVPNVASIANMYFSVGSEYGKTYKHDIAINYPSTITEYNSPVSVEVQLGQTVYGGTVDVVSGEMVVDMVYEDIKANVNSYARANADTSGQYFYRRWNANTGTVNSYTKQKFTSGVINNPYAYSSHTKNDVAVVLPSTLGAEIRVGNFGYDTLADWVAFVESQDVMGIVYTLAQPITVQLSPEQLTTLKGDNNVWSDADSVTVEYVADPKLYIDKKITAAVAALS